MCMKHSSKNVPIIIIDCNVNLFLRVCSMKLLIRKSYQYTTNEYSRFNV